MRWLVALARRPRSRSSVSSHGAHAETAVGRARIDVDWRFFVFKKMRWNVRILTISIQNLGTINRHSSTAIQCWYSSVVLQIRAAELIELLDRASVSPGNGSRREGLTGRAHQPRWIRAGSRSAIRCQQNMGDTTGEMEG